MRARLRSGQLKRLKKVGIRRRDKEGAEQLGLARLYYLDAASPLHTRMTEVVPLRTVVTAEPPRILFERRSLGLPRASHDAPDAKVGI